MANISNVIGSYVFDFSNTSTSPKERLEWLKKLQNLIGSSVEYCTIFPVLEGDYLEEYECADDIIELSFSACGRWTYCENLAFFEREPELDEVLKEMVGLKITGYFVEGEGGCGFIQTADFCILVTQASVSVSVANTKTYKYNPANLLEFGLEDYDSMMDWFEYSREELEQAIALGDEWTWDSIEREDF